MIHKILTPMPVLSIHSRQDRNPVLNGNYKDVCLEHVTLYHTDDNPTSTIKRGIFYQCDPTSSNQSASRPVSSSPKRTENGCWSRAHCSVSQTFLGAWHNPEPRSCSCQQPAHEHGPRTEILPQFSHSFVLRMPQTSSSKLPQLPEVVSMTKGAIVSHFYAVFFPTDFVNLQSHLKSTKHLQIPYHFCPFAVCPTFFKFPSLIHCTICFSFFLL